MASLYFEVKLGKFWTINHKKSKCLGFLCGFPLLKILEMSMRSGKSDEALALNLGKSNRT